MPIKLRSKVVLHDIVQLVDGSEFILPDRHLVDELVVLIDELLVEFRKL